MVYVIGQVPGCDALIDCMDVEDGCLETDPPSFRHRVKRI